MAYTAIDDPELYFQAKLWTGTGSENVITLDGDTDMQPDLVWIKCRSDADNHPLHDSIRGATNVVHPDTADAEYAVAQGLKSFGSDGFTLGTSNFVNQSSRTFVAWCWKASGSTAANTNGTNITSTVDANTTSGFSIVSWTGDNSGSSTVGHGLGKTAEFVNIKNRTDGSDWQTKHKNNSANASFSINASDAESSRVGSTNGGIADLSGTTTFGFIAGSAGVPAANGDSDDMIAYVWNSVQGFSKIGSYTGNGNADGPFVYTGFRPAFLITKRTDGVAGWSVKNNKTDPENPVDRALFANATDAEATDQYIIDFLSNGFKIRDASAGVNGDGSTYIYTAFAEAPFVNSNGVPCNAR